MACAVLATRLLRRAPQIADDIVTIVRAANDMRINVSDLRAVANRLFDHLESMGEHNIEVDHDYYWWIDRKQLYDPTTTPNDLFLGQLSDDWHELTKLLDGGNPISYFLVSFGAIVRAVGEEIVS